MGRLTVDGRIAVAIPSLDVTLELRDLSVGGFAISAPRPFWRGMTHWFTFSTQTGRSVTLAAKAVHCSESGNGRFFTGWEFMRGTAADSEAAIEQLLRSVT